MIQNSIKIIKRNGSIEPFNRAKIEIAVCSALKNVNVIDDDFCKNLANDVYCQLLSLKDKNEFDVPFVHELVQIALMSSNYKRAAIAYISYKHEHDLKRNLMSEVTKLIEQNNIDVQTENANKDSKIIPTQRDLVAGIVAKEYAIQQFFDKDLVHAHESGDLHIHDLDYSPLFPMFNCMLVDLNEMLSNGFKMGNAKIESPNSIGVAANVTTQIIASVSSHIYGGTTIGDIDIALTPYVLKSKRKLQRLAQYFVRDDKREQFVNEMLEKEVYDAMQLVEYQCSTLSTSNGQTPFVTIGFGLGTSPESKLIQKSILKVRMKGIGKDGITPTFPKLVFALKKGHNLNKEDPFYDVKLLALKCSSERMYPDILSYDKVKEITGGFKYPMGCRSFLHEWKNENAESVYHGRNNLGVTTVNLPRIALESRGDWIEFYRRLDIVLELAKRVSLSRIDRLRGVKASVAPILYTEGAMGVRLNQDDEIIKMFENGRASVSIGYIGINEVMKLMSNSSYDSCDFKERSVNILKYIKSKTDEFTLETGFSFSVYGTPAESLCYRFARLDKPLYEKYNKTEYCDKNYYTNSFHLDVRQKVNPIEKINFERDYLPYSSGGSIVYSEFPNMRHNLTALERVWDYAYDNVHYYGTNSPIDECFECGYRGEFRAETNCFVCPQCDNRNAKTFSVVRRICGYLGSGAISFNLGKQEEIQNRVKHF